MTLINRKVCQISLFFYFSLFLSLSLSLSLFRQALLLWLLASLFVGFCGFGFLASVFFLAVWLLASGFSGIGGIGG